MRTTLSFLTAPGNYEVDLPDHLDPVPDMSTITALEGAVRATVYAPASRQPDPASERRFWKHLFEATSDGIAISVYEQRQPPHQIGAFWRLNGGYVVAWAGDPDEPSDCLDGKDAINTIIRSLIVKQDAMGRPRLALRPPLQGADPRDPLQREVNTFWPREAGTWPVVQISKEPPWATERTETATYGEFVEAAVTNRHQIKVKAAGPQDTADNLQGVAAEVAISVD